MTTALCLSRNCYKPVVFDSGAYRNAGAPHMHMMPTWDHKNPSEYHKAARAELEERYGNFVQFVDRNVVDIEKTANEEDFVAEDGTGEKWVIRQKAYFGCGRQGRVAESPGLRRMLNQRNVSRFIIVDSRPCSINGSAASTVSTITATRIADRNWLACWPSSSWLRRRPSPTASFVAPCSSQRNSLSTPTALKMLVPIFKA